MLHLERKISKVFGSVDPEMQDKVVIIMPNGEEINVYLTRIGKDKAGMGFEFDPKYRVFRAELWEKIKNEGAK